MIIINIPNYTKPYTVSNVGKSKFVTNKKHNILIIVYNDMYTIYRYNKLIGQIIGGFVNIACYDYHSSTTNWHKRALCGYITGKHDIPFYEINSGYSIFGFAVTQYKNDTVSYGKLNLEALNCL